MSKHDKAVARLKSCPRDYKWDECVTLMGRLGYRLVQSGGGSHCFFYNDERDHVVQLYRPHPGNEMPLYLVKQVVRRLTDEGVIS